MRPITLLAQASTGVPGSITNPVIPEFELGTLIGNLIALGIIIAAILVLLYLVWGGIEWISSGGDKAGLESARNRITNAIIGLVLVVATWALMTLITTFLGFPFPKIPIPELTGQSGLQHHYACVSGLGCRYVTGPGADECQPHGPAACP